MSLRELIESVEAGDETAVIRVGGGIASAHRDVRAYWPFGDMVKAFRGSLDAAHHLHRDTFADWAAVIHSDGGVVLSDAGMDRNFTASCIDNPGRSWLLAILRAMEARDVKGEG